MTQHEKLVAQLTKQGYREVASRSTKYVVLTKDNLAFFYVGKAGALRYGRTVAESYSQDRIRKQLLAAYDREAQA